MKIKCIFIGVASAIVINIAQAATTTDVVCSYAPSQSVGVSRITAGIGGAGAGAAAILEAAGLTAVMHSSGAYIFTSAGGYVAGTIGSAVIAPVLITASVIVAGAAITVELSCAPKNHPETVKKMEAVAVAFNKAALSANAKAVVVRDSAGNKIREINGHAITGRDIAIDKVRNANERAVEFRDGVAKYFAGNF